ncbi:oxidoreductase [Denitromonas halophila]|uniref:Oxidoreductase n=2 Tax=Denitromonas halophila TaxID=1629404 RepID=A0A557R1Y4_9RHOO|nr:oxidoreductase [Denitromonas halophila]
MQKIRIGMIGAGETGTPLLRQLLDASFVELVGVADLSNDQPGMQLAHDRGVHTTNDFMDIGRMDAAVDIIIDATGVAQVRDSLRRHFQASGNHHTVIMHETILLLMMSLSQGQLVSGKHGARDYD